MIGDTTHDLQMAKNAGTHAVAVAYGAHSRDVLVNENLVEAKLDVHRLNACLLRYA